MTLVCFGKRSIGPTKLLAAAALVGQVALEGTKIVPVKPKLYLTCGLILEEGQWAKLPA